MSLIHKNLLFDHMFFSVPDAEFEEIKEIFLRFSCAKCSSTTSDGDSWEGVYIQTRGRNYFEILRNNSNNTIGLAMRPFNPLTQDARHIKTDLPDLPWQEFTRNLNGQKWFTALSLDNYLSFDTPFNTWIMHFFQRDTKLTIAFRPYEISRITEVHFSVNPNLLEKIKLNSSWINGKVTFTETRVTIEPQTYYSDPLLLDLKFDSSIEGFKFHKAVFKIEDGQNIPADLDLKHFKFFQKDEFVILEKKNSDTSVF